ncbi:MAG: lipid asymmetry maintenance protein MlaB [Limisphaerales bacterium]
MDGTNPIFTITESAGVLKLSGRLDIYATEAARAALLEHFGVLKSMRLDLAALEGCDAAGLQLLCAARKSAEQAGKSFKAELSPAVRECSSRLGLAPDFFEPIGI